MLHANAGARVLLNGFWAEKKKRFFCVLDLYERTNLSIVHIVRERARAQSVASVR